MSRPGVQYSEAVDAIIYSPALKALSAAESIRLAAAILDQTSGEPEAKEWETRIGSAYDKVDEILREMDPCKRCGGRGGFYEDPNQDCPGVNAAWSECPVCS